MKSTNYKFLTVMLAAFYFCGCSNEDVINSFNDNIPITDRIDFSNKEFSDNQTLNAFAFKFINMAASEKETIKNTDGNYSVSPLSATLCLGMLANSGDATMEEAVCKMVGVDDLGTLNSISNKLLRYLPSRVNGGIMTLANSSWYNEDITPAESWKSDMKDLFYSYVKGLDFKNESSVDLINDWCNRETKGLIPEILKYTDPSSCLYLLNALYFSGKWATPFDKSLSQMEVFHGSKGDASVDMMHSVGKNVYISGYDFSGVSLGFDGNTNLILLLPDEGTDVNALAESLKYEDFNDTASRYECNVTLSVPKFKIETSASIMGSLRSLGLPSNCSLTKMGIENATNVGIIQKTNTIIDEDGAKLAAVTIANMSWGIGHISKGDDVTFKVDRPFMFLIQNSSTGSILMAGVINNL